MGPEGRRLIACGNASTWQRAICHKLADQHDGTVETMGLSGRPQLEPVAVTHLDVEKLRPSPYRLRRQHSDSEIERLADSIRHVGLLEPLCVRPLRGDVYEVIAGERRWQAAQLLGISSVLCRVFNVTEQQAFVLAVTENLQRRELSPLEEAEAYQEMLDRGIARNRATIARILGVSRPRITQRMKLLELDPATQEKMQQYSSILTEYHGRLLVQVAKLRDRHRLADEAVASRWSGAQLKARLEEYRRKQEVEEWQLVDTRSPRSYRVSYPGFRLSINFLRADVNRVLDSLLSISARLQTFPHVRGRRPPYGDLPTGIGGGESPC
jgi:ParB/RepB/Spo0J family partition protein